MNHLLDQLSQIGVALRSTNAIRATQIAHIVGQLRSEGQATQPAEAVAWRWNGTMKAQFTESQFIAREWAKSGAVVTPLYAHPAPTSASTEPPRVLGEHGTLAQFETLPVISDANGCLIVDLRPALKRLESTQHTQPVLPHGTTHAVLKELVRLKRLHDRIERGEASDAEKLDYAQGKPVAWGDAFRLVDE